MHRFCTDLSTGTFVHYLSNSTKKQGKKYKNTKKDWAVCSEIFLVFLRALCYYNDNYTSECPVALSAAARQVGEEDKFTSICYRCRV